MHVPERSSRTLLPTFDRGKLLQCPGVFFPPTICPTLALSCSCRRPSTPLPQLVANFFAIVEKVRFAAAAGLLTVNVQSPPCKHLFCLEFGQPSSSSTPPRTSLPCSNLIVHSPHHHHHVSPTIPIYAPNAPLVSSEPFSPLATHRSLFTSPTDIIVDCLDHS
jgi:hypothetical protein